MKARELIEGASYGPDRVKRLGQAFDQAWAVLSPKVSSASSEDINNIARLRLKLAKAVLALAEKYGDDAEALKAAALRAMQVSP
jgi:hypothetical protein